MKFLLYFVFFISISSNISGTSRLDSLLELGKEYSYKFEFQKAEELFQIVIQQYPESPYAPHYLSRNNLWFYLGSKDSLYKNRFEKLNNVALEIAESLYKKESSNPKLNNLIGQIYLQKSILNATEGNSMDAFWATKSSLSYFEDALDLDKNYYDPYLGIGTIRYALSFIPGFLGWAISIAGLEGDKEEGLRFIKLSFDKGQSTHTEAAYHLSKIYIEYNAEYDSAKIYLNNLIHQYPKNILFLYQYAILDIETKNLNSAEANLDRILELNNEKFQQINSFSLFLKAEIAFKQNKFEKAISLYDRFLQHSSSIDYTGLAHLNTGLAYVMLENEILAKKYFILARNGNLDLAEDVTAKKLSYLYYDKTFSIDAKNIIIAENYFESADYQQAYNTISKIEISELELYEINKAKIIEAKILLEIDNTQKAKSVLKKVDFEKAANISSDIAEYYYLFAKISYVEGDGSSASKYLDLAFENCEESNNKLMRHLTHLNSKLNMK
ncbi:MAG: tetratricopeptide repeat protein [Bacteroidota bacterium]